VPLWLFSGGPVDDPLKPAEEPAGGDLVRETGAREHEVLPGGLDRRRLGWAERVMVRAVRVPDGDRRDWAEVTAWSTGIADTLSPAADRSDRNHQPRRSR